MKFALTHPYLPYMADKLLTGSYGEDRYCGSVCCSVCGEPISPGEEYYDVGGMFFCMRCEEAAETSILDEVRSGYIYEL